MRLENYSIIDISIIQSDLQFCVRACVCMCVWSRRKARARVYIMAEMRISSFIIPANSKLSLSCVRVHLSRQLIHARTHTHTHTHTHTRARARMHAPIRPCK